MKCDLCGGPVEMQEVHYAVEYAGQLYIVEHVPAKVCTQCGEKLYSPDTVSKIQKAIWENKTPHKIIELPVLDYVTIG